LTEKYANMAPLPINVFVSALNDNCYLCWGQEESAATWKCI
jgi:hypothetical protein